MKENLVYTLVIILILASCSSGELTRKKAEELILEKYYQPKGYIEAKGYLPLGEVSFSTKNTDESLKAYKNLKDLKFLEIKFITQKRHMMGVSNIYNIELTEKGKEFYRISEGLLNNKNKEVVIGKIYLNEITGIKINDSGNKATVEYNTILKDLNEFADAINMFYKNKRHEENKLTDWVGYFEKYDDGWRFKRVHTK